MAASKVYETQFRLGAKFTGAPAFAAANRAIDHAERNAKGLNSTLSRMSSRLAGVGKIAVGAFAALGAANVLGRIIQGLEDLGRASILAANDVQQTHEQMTLLLKSFGLADKDAEAVEKRLYGIADAMEKSAKGGHDAETMVRVLAGVKKVMPSDQVVNNAGLLSDYLTSIGGVAPTVEQAQEAVANFNAAVLRGRGPLLAQLGWDKTRMANFGKLSALQRRAILLEEMQRKFGGLTAKAMASDSGKMAQAWTQAQNILETLGAGVVEQKGRIGDALKGIAIQLQKVAEQFSVWLTPKLKEFLDTANKNMPQIQASIDKWIDRLVALFNVLDTIRNVWWNVFTGPTLDLIAKAVDLFDKWSPILDRVAMILDINITNGLEAVKRGMGELADFWIDKCNEMIKVLEKFKFLAEPLKWLWQTAPQLPPGVGVPRTMEPYTGTTPWGMEATKPSTGYAPYERERGGGAVPAAGIIPPAQTIANAGAAQNVGALKDVRARIAEELQQPGMEQLLMASTQAEVGNQPAHVQQAYMESVMNRAAAENKTLRAIITNPNYYPSATKAKLGRTFSGPQAERMRSLIAGAVGGSNIAKFATGNESGGVRSGGAPILHDPGTGERFVGENWTRDWIAKMKATAAQQAPTPKLADVIAKTTAQTQPTMNPYFRSMKSPPFWGEAAVPKPLKFPKTPLVPTGSSLKDTIKGINMRQRMEATGPTNVAMNPTITINGVEAGKEQAVADAVKNAMQDPTQNLLAQLKKARNQEARLGYV
jgi:hypothetical protein